MTCVQWNLNQRKITSNTGSLFNADIERKAMNSMEYTFFLFI